MSSFQRNGMHYYVHIQLMQKSVPVNITSINDYFSLLQNIFKKLIHKKHGLCVNNVLSKLQVLSNNIGNKISTKLPFILLFFIHKYHNIITYIKYKYSITWNAG